MEGALANNTKPLCFLPSGRLVAYKRGKLSIFSGDTPEESYELFRSKKETVLGRSKWLTRLLRLGVKQAMALDEDHVILSVGNRIYEYCFSKRELSSGFVADGRIRPLYFTEIRNIPGFDDGVVWGGYLVNMDKKPVHIYRRTGVDKWETVFSFETGAVNHIHNIVPDPYRECLWVFTGDFGEAAAIWKVTDNFRHVERAVCNDQTYRACVAFALPEGLLYATDNPYFNNFIYLIRDTSTMEKEVVAPLSGSCIYGCKWKEQFVFSSTVEADNYEHVSWIDLLFRHPLGAGVKDDYAHLYIGDLTNGFREVLKRKKDRLSYLFQFGAFMFPMGKNDSETLFFYPVATTSDDLSLMAHSE